MRGYESYWAKSDHGGTTKWRPYAEHVAAVVACAEVYCELNPLLVTRIAERLGTNDATALQFVRAAAALHDLGKLFVLFQAKVPTGFERTYGSSNVQLFEKGGKYAFSEGYYHGVDGHSLMIYISNSHLDKMPKAYVAALYAGSWHHGTFQQDAHASKLQSWYDYWAKHPYVKNDVDAMWAFVEDVRIAHPLPYIPNINSKTTEWDSACLAEAKNMVAGIVALADWCGSDEGTDTENYFSLAYDWTPRTYQECYSCERIRQTARKLITQRYPKLPPQKHSFSSMLRGKPTDLQHAIMSNPPGQLTIIEAPTGDGKTEAALMLFESLFNQGKVDRLIFGLPTKATTTMMWTRVRDMMSSSFGVDPKVITLQHGDARRHIRMLEEIPWKDDPSWEDASQIGSQKSSGVDHRYLHRSKRSMLSAVSVVTVDQILMAVLKGHKHKFVRSMPMSTSLVVIDEVHAVDTYMQGILATVLKLLAFSGAHVVLLSATLTTQARQTLVAPFSQETIPDSNEPVRITTVNDRQIQVHGLSSRRQNTKISVTSIPHDWDLVRGFARPAMADVQKVAQSLVDSVRAGGCVAWIRNTVWDVQTLVPFLSQIASDIEVLYLHASLCATEREVVESRVKAILGPDSEDRHPVLVIGTSILGVSLDLDFDRMVVDLTTFDNLVQAVGRLHRHNRPRPVTMGDKVLEVFHPREMEGRNIYDMANDDDAQLPMYKTWGWVKNTTSFEDPNDVREILDHIYEEVDPLTGHAKERYDADVANRRKREQWSEFNIVQPGTNAKPENGGRKPTRTGLPNAPILMVALNGTYLTVPHMPQFEATWKNGQPFSGVDIAPLLDLDLSNPKALKEHLKSEAIWKIWQRLEIMVKQAHACRSTLIATEVKTVIGDKDAQFLSELWDKAGNMPHGTLFVPVQNGAGAVVRDRDGKTRTYSVRYEARYGLIVE